RWKNNWIGQCKIPCPWPLRPNTVCQIKFRLGHLSLKRAHKGIFVTTSAFSQSAVQTARDLHSRIVLIDGIQLAQLMIRYNIGCRNEEVLYLKKVDEDFFE
ncbi:restriction system protein, partial [Nitrosospira briensis]